MITRPRCNTYIVSELSDANWRWLAANGCFLSDCVHYVAVYVTTDRAQAAFDLLGKGFLERPSDYVQMV
jgi:hypothetical protein